MNHNSQLTASSRIQVPLVSHCCNERADLWRPDPSSKHLLKTSIRYWTFETTFQNALSRFRPQSSNSLCLFRSASAVTLQLLKMRKISI